MNNINRYRKRRGLIYDINYFHLNITQSKTFGNFQFHNEQEAKHPDIFQQVYLLLVLNGYYPSLRKAISAIALSSYVISLRLDRGCQFWSLFILGPRTFRKETKKSTSFPGRVHKSCYWPRIIEWYRKLQL